MTMPRTRGVETAAPRRAGAEPGPAVRSPRAGQADSTALVAGRLLVAAGALVVLATLLWQALLSGGGTPDPTVAATRSAAALDVGVLVFREGLECILVLAAITASLVGATRAYRRPIVAGVVGGVLATLVTWQVAVTIVDSLTESFPALHVQAATGLLAIVVLLVVMNWFFHKVYWTGWIGLHTKRKRELLRQHDREQVSRVGLLWGLGLLGFSSFYREGFEVVLFLQSYRLKLGEAPVLRGVSIGLLLTGIVAVLTFVAHQRLPYRKMLVLTGVLLGGVLLVMVGEQAQEMQLAHWLPTTPIPALADRIPGWAELWLAVFPTVETLAAQALAAVLVLGSYAAVQVRLARQQRVPAARGTGA